MDVKDVTGWENEKLLKFLLLTKYYSGDQITEDEMGGACGMYRRRQGSRVGGHELD